MKIRLEELKKCKKVVVSQHALEAWNRRVGPVVHSRHILSDQLTQYLKGCHEIRRLKYYCLIFGDEIVAGCMVSKGVLVIRTFFGRISTNPILRNVEHLLTFAYQDIRNNRQIYKHAKKDGIPLDLPHEVLQRQQLPFPEGKYIDRSRYALL